MKWPLMGRQIILIRSKQPYFKSLIFDTLHLIHRLQWQGFSSKMVDICFPQSFASQTCFVNSMPLAN